jgi:hypothetical protein
MKKLHQIEGHQEQVKVELEKSIQYFQSMIEKYEDDYSKNEELLKGVSENLYNLLENVIIILIFHVMLVLIVFLFHLDCCR